LEFISACGRESSHLARYSTLVIYKIIKNMEPGCYMVNMEKIQNVSSCVGIGNRMGPRYNFPQFMFSKFHKIAQVEVTRVRQFGNFENSSEINP
jgi:hypothetical protein